MLLLGGFVGFAAGCKRQPSTAVTPAPPVPGQAELASNAPGGSASAPVSVPPVAADPASAPDLTQINQAYIGWIMQSRKHVKTVEEYISASGAQLPAPPAGKKYIIDHNGYIALVKR